eukprot:11537811-Alexandrium_andersonii.AAC.1
MPPLRTQRLPPTSRQRPRSGSRAAFPATPCPGWTRTAFPAAPCPAVQLQLSCCSGARSIEA